MRTTRRHTIAAGLAALTLGLCAQREAESYELGVIDFQVDTLAIQQALADLGYLSFPVSGSATVIDGQVITYLGDGVSVSYPSDFSSSNLLQNFATDMVASLRDVWSGLAPQTRARLSGQVIALEALSDQLGTTGSFNPNTGELEFYGLGHDGLATAGQRRNTILHELGHAFDYALGNGQLASSSSTFVAKARADGLLDAYRHAANPAAEAFAEVFRRIQTGLCNGNHAIQNYSGESVNAVQSCIMVRDTWMPWEPYIQDLSGLTDQVLAELENTLYAAEAYWSSNTFPTAGLDYWDLGWTSGGGGGGTPVVTIYGP